MPLSVSVRLPDKTAQALDELANATDRSRTYLIVRALKAFSRLTGTAEVGSTVKLFDGATRALRPVDHRPRSRHRIAAI